MYNAGELRLNNWLNFDSVDCPVQIDGIQSYMLSFNGSFTSIDDFNPIPLTEEILIKVGFNYADDENYFLQLPVFGMFKFMLHSDKSDNFEIVTFSIKDVSKEVRSVHQLQNLYYTLTGEELEIKL